jgi:hypothetical protein
MFGPLRTLATLTQQGLDAVTHLLAPATELRAEPSGCGCLHYCDDNDEPLPPLTNIPGAAGPTGKPVSTTWTNWSGSFPRPSPPQPDTATSRTAAAELRDDAERMAEQEAVEPGQLNLIAGRIEHVRAICESSIAHDRHGARPGELTDRQWLAQSVLNILDGNIDAQIITDATK